MIQIGDLVTRNSYHNDIIFKVVDINGDMCYLCGISVRLSADSPLSDLVLCDKEEVDDNFGVDFNEYKTLDRHEFFYLPGKVLHIDGDEDFLDRCMKFYHKNRIKAYGIYSLEGDLSNHIYEYLEKAG